jgi:predicted Zn finger-like uncharacterized protein
MIWITRCPTCGVTYKVTPDQLNVAQAWLRCGKCQEAFDSTGLVVAWPFEINKFEPTAVPESAADRLDIDELLQQEDRSALVTPVAAFEEALSGFIPTPLLPITTATSSAVLGAPSGTVLAHDNGPADQSPGSALSASSLWPMVFVSILSLALALQWIGVGRHLLVAAEPALAQSLHTLCRILGCEMVPPPTRNGVVIESSSMTPRDGGLVLLWSVRNVTTQALEMPALELTWLDAHDQVLVRRVLLPTEQAAPSALAAGQIWSGQLQLLPAEGIRPLGYRLVSFYP